MIGGDHTQNNWSFFLDISKGHIPSDFIDVLRLFTNRDRCNTRQINNSQVRTSGWKNVQNYRDIFNNFFGSTNLICNLINSFSNFIEIFESLFFSTILYLIKFRIWCSQTGYLVHSKFKRSSGDNTLNKTQIITDPLGRKSSPTICYSKELLPDDWLPNTTTLGSESCLSSPISLSKSTRVITFLSSCTNMLPYILC